MHSNRYRTRSKGKQSCDQNKTKGRWLNFDGTKWHAVIPNNGAQTISGLLQQQTIAEAVTR
eukprot:7978279-Prorocentrum_lima.AAC.1